MDDKKKIIFLSIAIVVAIGLIVLIVVTKRGGEIAGLTGLPSTPPFTTPGTPTGTSGQPGGPGQTGQPGNIPGAASFTAPNAFIPKQLPGENSGFTRTVGGFYVAPGTPQSKEFVPTPIGISDSYLISQIPSSTIADILKSAGTDIFTTSTVLKMASNYLKDLSKMPTDPAKLQAILNNISSTVATLPTPQQMAQQFLNSSNTTDALNALNSLSGFQGITADQLAYLQSLTTATSTAAINQSLINLGMQDQSFINNFLANATGSISVDRLRQLLQQSSVNTSAICAQISQQVEGLNSLQQQAGELGATDILGLGAISQYLPMQSCSSSASQAQGQG